MNFGLLNGIKKNIGTKLERFSIKTKTLIIENAPKKLTEIRNKCFGGLFAVWRALILKSVVSSIFKQKWFEMFDPVTNRIFNQKTLDIFESRKKGNC